LVLPLFSSEVFGMSPFAFFGVASFFIGGLLNEPLYIFWGCLFIGGLLNEPLYVFWGCLFFQRRSFQQANE
jgi:hypothetical protein